LASLAVSSVPLAISGVNYVGFIDANTIAISKADGLFRMPLSVLDFVRFE